MEHLFSAVLTMSIRATLLSVPVLFLKWSLEKLGIPRKITFLLWLIIGFRLMFPVSLPSAFSIQNLFPETDTLTPALSVTLLHGSTPLTPIQPHSPLPSLGFYIWLSGISLLLLYDLISYLRLRKQLRFSAKAGHRIYTSEWIPSSFVLGILRPRIYLPAATAEPHLSYVLLHETTHIRRGDPFFKLVARLLLAIHWFNPFLWILFYLFASDIEYACDEACLVALGKAKKSGYLHTLLAAAQECPSLAFRTICTFSNPTKRRIRVALNQRTYSRFATVCGTLLCLVAFGVFGTNAMELPPLTESAVLIPAPSPASTPPPEKPKPAVAQRIVQPSVSKQKPSAPQPSPSPQATPEQDSQTFSYPNGSPATISNVICNHQGEVSMTFDLNTESLVNVVISDSETNEKVADSVILADNQPHTFSGLNPEKNYTVTVQGTTESQWKIKGSYTID